MKLTARILVLFHMVFLFSIDGFAQVKTYAEQWKKVDELIEKQNLPQSALQEVKKIYATAKKEKQEAQVIKSLVYITGLQQPARENNLAQAIQQVEKEIKNSAEPAASILKSMLAGLYWQYFQTHRWQLYNRTPTENISNTDIETWSIADFHQKIGALYLQSVERKKLLQQTGLKPYNAIISKGNVGHLRPTLYDLLAHKALTYFKNPERDLDKPAYAFEMVQPEAFAPAAVFANHFFATKDSQSLQHKALIIFQNLLQFHLKDTSTDALIDADVERISFVYNNAVMKNKDSLYVRALKQILAAYPANKTTNQAAYLLAAFFNQQANLYHPLKDITHRYDRIKAKNILQAVVSDSSVKNQGWANSFNLLQQITKASFSFETEKVNLPGQPFRALVKYTNISNLYLRLIKADDKLQQELSSNNGVNSFWNLLLEAPPVRVWQQSLPATADLQEHAVEIKVDGLPAGAYYLVAATGKQFQKQNNALAAQLVYSSNISYISQGNSFFILHRQSGHALAGAKVDVYRQHYDYKTSKYIKTKQQTFIADKNGFFKIEKDDESKTNYNYFLDISYGGERLTLDDNNHYFSYYDNEKEEPDTVKKIFFFTDRAIYRPGQTVYFKGIVVSRQQKQPELAAGFKTQLFLMDANGNDVDSVQVVANLFGSFSGKFQLPKNSLNGTFQIYDDEDNNSTTFSVEAYKLPKFYVNFEPLQTAYKLNDTISVTGNATAYAGNNVNDALVSYRVVRQTHFPHPWQARSIWWAAAPQELAHGTTTTDENGRFSISFVAVPDLKIKPTLQPVFEYQIYADVTDLNGETRSAETSINAGYTSMILELKLPNKISSDSLNHIAVSTVNRNGSHVPAPLTVTISRLAAEQRLIRERYWQQPDTFVMTKAAYLSYFPHDEYSDEADYTNWPVAATVIKFTDSSRFNNLLPLPKIKWQPGYYRIEALAADSSGTAVRDVAFIEVFNENNQTFLRPEYLWVESSSNPVTPGKDAIVKIGSAANSVFLINEASREGQPPHFKFGTLDQEKKSFVFPVSEADRGGFGLNFFFVKDNRFYQLAHTANVPWNNKELSIAYTTIRNKILPGATEQWKVKVSGYKSEAVAAEMLASMYDASLDQFKPHNWQRPNVWPVFTQLKLWNGRENFTFRTSINKWIALPARSVYKQYDELMLAFNRHEDVFKRAGSPAPLQAALQGKISGVVADSAAFNEVVVTAFGATKRTETKALEETRQPATQPRKNFNETAFFFPDLRTDENGNIEFIFTAPEALTRWKLQTLAHTKSLATGLSQQEVVTQKELMVQPNAPRFLRQGDHIEFSTKIANLSDQEITGQVQLELFDAATHTSVDGWFINSFPNQYFTAPAGQSVAVKFPIQVPYQFNDALIWRITARASNWSDAEESVLPVLTNKVLVTETLPLPMQGSGSKSFQFEKLLNSNQSESLLNQSLTIAFTSNPAWYAVQALPYLSETKNESVDQAWNRYYANSLAAHIVKAAPRIQQVFERWKNDSAALLSNLQKNEELKSVLLAETPWVLQAKSEAEQKKNIANLFDGLRLKSDLNSSLEKLKQMQAPNGGFVWFTGAPDDRYMTQNILTGIGHLKKLGVPVNELNTLTSAALAYADNKIAEDYKQLLKIKADLKKQQLNALSIQYLYLRSFFTGHPVLPEAQTAYKFYKKQAQQFWMKQNLYLQGMIALTLYRSGDVATAKAILRSLKENSINNEETGRFWKNNYFGRSWLWWYAPIETQSLMVEAFDEIAADTTTVNELRTWLIKNKQTNTWRTSKATAHAVYAMLLQGSDWLSNNPEVQIQLGNVIISNQTQHTEAGTGYLKKTIDGLLVQPAMGNITVGVHQTNNYNVNAPSWGAVYWQYFEDADKITSAATPLQLNKELFLEQRTDRGPVLTQVNDGTALRIGDKIKVRVVLRVDRDMEYVHMKDMRASALEPVNVLSGYKWQGGLGYYETTKDAATHFFFNYLPKGTYVFEYPLFVTHAGTFTNGITTIECLYAPEFSAHSEGVKISVE